jgi:hypothetical protein
MNPIITIDGRKERIPKKSLIDVYISNEFEGFEEDDLVVNVVQNRKLSRRKWEAKGYDRPVHFRYIYMGHVTLWVSDSKETYFTVKPKGGLLQ